MYLRCGEIVFIDILRYWSSIFADRTARLFQIQNNRQIKGDQASHGSLKRFVIENEHSRLFYDKGSPHPWSVFAGNIRNPPEDAGINYIIKLGCWRFDIDRKSRISCKNGSTRWKHHDNRLEFKANSFRCSNQCIPYQIWDFRWDSSLNTVLDLAITVSWASHCSGSCLQENSCTQSSSSTVPAAVLRQTWDLHRD